MKCPVCKDITLLMMDKKGIEIDYCPECRGIWLDRGELEKLIGAEKSYNETHDSYENEKDFQNRDYSGQSSHKNKRRESFFERLDFFD